MHGATLVPVFACALFIAGPLQNGDLLQAVGRYAGREMLPGVPEVRDTDVVLIMTWNIRDNNPSRI
jgi:hypothetical protein